MVGILELNEDTPNFVGKADCGALWNWKCRDCDCTERALIDGEVRGGPRARARRRSRLPYRLRRRESSPTTTVMALLRRPNFVRCLLFPVRRQINDLLRYVGFAACAARPYPSSSSKGLVIAKVFATSNRSWLSFSMVRCLQSYTGKWATDATADGGTRGLRWRVSSRARGRPPRPRSGAVAGSLPASRRRLVLTPGK